MTVGVKSGSRFSGEADVAKRICFGAMDWHRATHMDAVSELAEAVTAENSARDQEGAANVANR